MQFLAQILLDGPGRPVVEPGVGVARVMALFMCQNDPGSCEEWSPTAGGNRALLHPAAGLQPMAAPELDAEDGEFDEEVLRLGAVNGVALVPWPTADYFAARREWADRTGDGTRQILGQLGGRPAWLQYDETPTCAGCAESMALVAQLEEGPCASTAMNFGSGKAFAFACGPCDRAVFLWQC
ncbi:hypothetical protein [Kitasatospora sp. MBT63]|uniref:hypothetical protein n=2 Tax=unclassified Kitasatospora TaxID=2633591 RepID=UPI000AFDAA79|nr:hypothetical protein [Kitasatospora sp. MBT63]